MEGELTAHTRPTHSTRRDREMHPSVISACCMKFVDCSCGAVAVPLVEKALSSPDLCWPRRQRWGGNLRDGGI